jgi:hypothetical protein
LYGLDQARAVAIMAMMAFHFAPGLFMHLPSLQPLVSSVLWFGRMATPAFVTVFGVTAGFVFLPKFVRGQPGDIPYRLRRRAFWIFVCAIAITIPSWIKLATRGESYVWPWLYKFYSVLLFYAIALVIVPYWLRWLSRHTEVRALVAGLALWVAGSVGYHCWPQAAVDSPALLPAGWGDLEFSSAQKQAIYRIHREHAAAVDAPGADVEELNRQRRERMLEVLSPEQRSALAAEDSPQLREVVWPPAQIAWPEFIRLVLLSGDYGYLQMMGTALLAMPIGLRLRKALDAGVDGRFLVHLFVCGLVLSALGAAWGVALGEYNMRDIIEGKLKIPPHGWYFLHFGAIALAAIAGFELLTRNIGVLRGPGYVLALFGQTSLVLYTAHAFVLPSLEIADFAVTLRGLSRVIAGFIPFALFCVVVMYLRHRRLNREGERKANPPVNSGQ